MYKLSLAFEQQAKPERAEAVLEWMKRTQSATASRDDDTLTSRKLTGAPQRLGRYVIEKRIGRGAMGAVYLAKDPRINRAVALKAIPIEKEFEDEELKEARLRFYREAESAGRLTHPNIITVFDAGEEKGLAYIAMEYVPGIPLQAASPTRRNFWRPNVPSNSLPPQPRPWITPTTRASFTATSSQPTCSTTRKRVRSRSAILASRA